LGDFFAGALDPLEPVRPVAYGPIMGVVEQDPGDDGDVEVFERIPWESLERQADHRWIVYLVAAALVAGAVGLSLGRQGLPSPDAAAPPAPAPPLNPAPPLTTAASVTTAAPARDLATSPGPAAGPPSAGGDGLPPAEADLMALADAPLELTAAAVAEWFVTDFFTRRGGEGGRSFVEWAGVVAFRWEAPTRAALTVGVVRLAAKEADEYRRVDPEAWNVVLELDGDGWRVVDGPVAVPGGFLPEVAAAGAGPVSEWVDGAGLRWQVRGEATEVP
jgi:hypothetical protein